MSKADPSIAAWMSRFRGACKVDRADVTLTVRQITRRDKTVETDTSLSAGASTPRIPGVDLTVADGRAGHRRAGKTDLDVDREVTLRVHRPGKPWGAS